MSNTEDRLASLERHLRRTRLAVAVMAAVLAGACLIAAGPALVTVACKELTVKDATGKTVVELKGNGDVEITGKLNSPSVPLGMMLPYFGKDLPKGFVWADGEARWPNKTQAPWLPAHLAGEKVPNMQGYLVGGAMNELEVGTPYKDGKITVDGSTFENSPPTLVDTNETLKEPKSGCDALAMTYIVRDKPVNYGDNVVNTHWYDLRTTQGGAFQAQFKAHPISIKSYAYNGKLKNKCDVKLDVQATNPRHFRCRWIIRVE
jgi:hypothetical protein